MVQYWNKKTGSSNHLQEGDLHQRKSPRRYPNIFAHGPFNEYGYDSGLPNRFSQNRDGLWEYEFMYVHLGLPTYEHQSMLTATSGASYQAKSKPMSGESRQMANLISQEHLAMLTTTRYSTFYHPCRCWRMLSGLTKLRRLPTSHIASL